MFSITNEAQNCREYSRKSRCQSHIDFVYCVCRLAFPFCFCFRFVFLIKLCLILALVVWLVYVALRFVFFFFFCFFISRRRSPLCKKFIIGSLKALLTRFCCHHYVHRSAHALQLMSIFSNLRFSVFFCFLFVVIFV